MVFSSEVQAQEIQNIQEDMTEIPSVSELSEVESEEWNFQVLQNFIQRYNIDTKYPLANLQRQDVITRYEFALILNEVIQYINNSQTTNTNIKKTNSISQQELEYLSKLQNEFAFELHGINQRIEILETQNFPQFSTTSKLRGEVIFALTGVGEGNKADDDQKTDSNVTFSSRTKLQLNTTFTGKDRLKTSLKTSNIQPLDSATGTNMARLSAEGDDQNQFELGDFAYRFPVGKRARVHIGSTGLEIDDFANTINPYLDANDDGAVSRFAQRNPIYRQGGGAG
ncbi:MAG: iron uptake porin, partial [Rivularia sp. (in: cyanobacteria)]